MLPLLGGCAHVTSDDGLLGSDNEALTHVVGLRVDGRQQVAKCVAHPVQLVDQIEDDPDALRIDPEVALEIVDQFGACDICFRELSTALAAQDQPTRSHPMLQSLGFKAGAIKKFAMIHVHVPVVVVERSSRSCCHWLMNCASSGSGLAGSTTESFTYSSPRPPSRRGTPLPLSLKTLPLLDHLGTVILTGPSGVGTSTLPPSTAVRSGTATSTRMSSLSRVNTGWGRTATSIKASPGGPPLSPGAPLPRRRRICPSRVPGGIVTSRAEPSGSVICCLPPLTASRKPSSRR